MTLLERIQPHLDQDAALAVVLERCALWTLEPCVAGNPTYITGSRYASCNHCVAELLLRDIGTAIGVYP